MDALKKIGIKSSTVRRYIKDINYYKKESEELSVKWENYANYEPDFCPHVLKKIEERMEENETVIADCETRLVTAKDDLQEFLLSHSDSEEITSSDIYKEAQALIV